MSGPVKIFIGIFLAFSLVFPLGNMLFNMAGTDIGAVFVSNQFREALRHSIVASGIVTLISIFFAWFFALAVVRSNMRFRNIFAVLGTVPMLIPSISHGMGLVILLGSNGILTRLFGLQGTIYGFWGIIAGSVLYAFPVAFLMLSDILVYEDDAPYEAAKVLGIPKANQFFSITFPYLRKPLISVIFAVFTLIFTDYGVPLTIGGRYTTLPVLMYQEVIGLLNFSRGSVIGSFLLIPALAAFLFDLFNKDKGNMNFTIQQRNIPNNRIRDWTASLYSMVVCSIIALPLVLFAVLCFIKNYPTDMSFSVNNIFKTLNLGAGRYLINSVIIALAVSILGTALSYTIACFTARNPEQSPNASSRLLHLVSITSLAVPGLVLGISYALFFKGYFIYGTLAMLILVNIIHFMASPYLMAYNSLGKINPYLEDVGQTLGVRRLFIIRDVLIPQTKLTILEMLSFFFVNSMMTISAVSFLSTVRNKPVSLMINQFEANLFLEGAAFISILILLCNLAVKLIVYLVRHFSKE
ncbi:MAG: ABC transporter permease subunit [Treponema sp.]|jgi:iron(III) transport system permease protein|nr:ABC transporter permease subunit [Treponema sp.]